MKTVERHRRGGERVSQVARIVRTGDAVEPPDPCEMDADIEPPDAEEIEASVEPPQMMDVSVLQTLASKDGERLIKARAPAGVTDGCQYGPAFTRM